MKFYLAIFTISILVTCSSLNAQETDPEICPETLVGFIKSGMQIGMRTHGDGVVDSVVVFTPEEFAIVKDARSFGIDELSSRYPSVSVLRDKAIAKAKMDHESLMNEGGRYATQEYGDPVASKTYDTRLMLCTVTHVGTDYLLVAYGDDNNRRKALSTRHIANVRWGETLKVRASVPRLKMKKGD